MMSQIPLLYRVISDIEPDRLGDVLTLLSADGFTDWQILIQQEVCRVRIDGNGTKTQTTEMTKYRVVAWTESEEEE